MFAYLWGELSQFDVKGVILNERSLLRLFYEFVQRAKEWTVWCDVVEDPGYRVSLALDNHMLHT